MVVHALLTCECDDLMGTFKSVGTLPCEAQADRLLMWQWGQGFGDNLSVMPFKNTTCGCSLAL
jgi:hypothetical protein